MTFCFSRSKECIDNHLVIFSINLIDNCEHFQSPLLVSLFALVFFFLIYNNVYHYFTLWPFGEFSKKGISLQENNRKLHTDIQNEKVAYNND